MEAFWGHLGVILAASWGSWLLEAAPGCLWFLLAVFWLLLAWLRPAAPGFSWQLLLAVPFLAVPSQIYMIFFPSDHGHRKQSLPPSMFSEVGADQGPGEPLLAVFWSGT